MFIVFRVDASNIIGTGHLKRCLNLAKQLKKKGNRVEFFCQKFRGDLTYEIKEKKFSLNLIKNKFSRLKKKILSNHFRL